MSAVNFVSLRPVGFDALMYDKSPSVGGSAASYQHLTSLGKPADGTDGQAHPYGAEHINYDVQDATSMFHNTSRCLRKRSASRVPKSGCRFCSAKASPLLAHGLASPLLADLWLKNGLPARWHADLDGFPQARRRIRRLATRS
ncbi:hypothetical protein K437DRAFT_147192 [Tilletiaria anomala UBC 951]|uniref:Uncharacterized protein n=1 Tax=Tilletiaria anomala (strain ATCC 24038 / CBS 436.72 / UBC 951) TaxID=1037660 RepID=A0A066VXW9_TILAU|nr:uncharacterized protein K437DRAFT_147192 [Tilletiaria anomala UBC 951]KDN43669.1 hypothetical protein K437DRAFT_147192 [Tilletiaria anomala UBC 951]